jgi:hypothetical protein
VERIQAKGQHGSWFATVSGERLPCVHKHWWRKGATYHDPNARPGEPKWDEFIFSIRALKRVILTDDEPWDGTGAFVRKGYIAVFDIDDFKLDGSDLTFRFSRRIVDLI